MNRQQLAGLKIKEIKAIARGKNLIPAADKRKKATWIDILLGIGELQKPKAPRRPGTRKQAPKGGIFGINGDFYKGGQFLPTNIQTTKGLNTAKKARKVQIERFKWVESREHEGFEPLLKKLNVGVFSRFDHDGKVHFNCPESAIAYYNVDRKEIEKLCKLYNFGFRWLKIKA